MGGLLLSLTPLTNAALALLLVFGVVTTGESVFYIAISHCKMDLSQIAKCICLKLQNVCCLQL